MLKVIRVSAMLLVLVGSARAGEVLTPPAPQPQANTVQEPTTAGDIQNGAADSLTQLALDVFASLPFLF
jgi:hypothetical protein